MPAPASAAAPRRRSPSPAAHRPLRLSLRTGKVRVRWDRLGRVAMLVVFAVVVALGSNQALTLLSTRSQAEEQLAIVQRLVVENRRLAAQQQALRDPATIARDARALGMVRPGERPYVITGQPAR